MKPAVLISTLALLLAGCGTSQPPSPASLDDSVVQPVPPQRLSAAEHAALGRMQAQQRDAALQAQREGRWRAAEMAWAVVLALDPADDVAQAGLAEARRAALLTGAEQLRRAEQAQARGDADNAMRLYLEALAADPTLTPAIDALRGLELDRARRNALPSFAAPARPAGARAGPELEHAELLVAEGEIDAALTLLEPLAREPRADAALKSRVCGLLLQQAAGNPAPPQALALVRRCLRLLPRHAPALQRQAALQGGKPAAPR